MSWLDIFRLHETGVLGINGRNLDYVLRHNPRQYYQNVDDKARTKKLAIAAGIPAPELYTIIEYQEQITRLADTLSAYDNFVIKPAKGSGGGGILVITGKRGDNYIKASGKVISLPELRYHISNILGGLYTLGGVRDAAIVESLIQNTPLFNDLSFQGVPDIRLIVYQGVPVMAMLRLSTCQSEGKANLHSGGIGVGVCVQRGMSIRAISANRSITHHPDTGNSLIGVALPHWDDILAMGVKAANMTHLGYLGVDIVIDKNHGPLLLEVNARPGIAIQIANEAGLCDRLDLVDAHVDTLKTEGDCIAFAKKNFKSNLIA